MNIVRKALYLTLGVVFAGLALCSSNAFSDVQESLEARAMAGDVVAMRELGYDLHEGLNGKKNPSEAVKWFREAADHGDKHSQFMMGVLYHEGRGVPKDAVLAYMWMNLAAASGNIEAASIRENLGRGMAPEQVAEAQRLGREWKPKTVPDRMFEREPKQKEQTSIQFADLPLVNRKEQDKPRFDLGAFCGTALPSVVILSGVALGALLRKRRDAARLASGKPPLAYEHQVGALAGLFYMAGAGALLAMPRSGAWTIGLALGALFHFLRIGTLRRKALRDADRSDGQV